MAIYLAPIGSGLGDVVICRPALDWLIANNDQPIYLVARGPRQVGMSVLIEGLAGEVQEPDLVELLKPTDSYYNLRNHPLQRYEDWLSEEFRLKYPNYKITQLLSTICSDLGIKADFNEFKSFNYNIDPRASGKIILIPGSTVRHKMLKRKVWIELYETLKQQDIESIVVGLPEFCEETRALVEFGLTHIETKSVTEVVNLISSATAVISVDTGLMHIAVQQGVKTIAIFGDCELYYRPRDNCIPVFAGRSPDKSSQIVGENHDFPVSIQSWHWHPPDWNKEDYLNFQDIDQLLGLALQAI